MVISIAPQMTVHFIGIGGIGMSGIAEVLISMGFKVTGSDLNRSQNTQKLETLGAKIYIGHQQENIDGVDLIVVSSAINNLNPEIQRAKELRLPIMKRAEMLAELMRLKQGIAVGGTHGKTTTTSMLATVLKEADFDPTYIIGGVVNNLNGHARVGTGEFLIAEADESDGTFLFLNPVYSIITNIDNDHMDHYGNEGELINAFHSFANQVPFYGVCALNAHDHHLANIHKNMKKPSLTFGIEGLKAYMDVDIEARNINYSINQTSFDLYIHNKLVTQIHINIPGPHNVLNCLGALSIAHHLGLSAEQMAKGAKCFKGVGRRFQTLYEKNNLIVIDDYGHHPTEIQATLETARKVGGDKSIIVIFEPHRFSRTRDCWDGFLHCFNSAGRVYLGPIYPASESPIVGIDSQRMAEDINQLHPNLVETIDSIEKIGEVIKKYENENAIVLTLGAGSIGKEVQKWRSSIN